MTDTDRKSERDYKIAALEISMAVTRGRMQACALGSSFYYAQKRELESLKQQVAALKED